MPDSRSDDFICGVVEGFYGRPWTTSQRKDLFSKMKQLGLNTYMYAPKDDFKHRAYWRELYSVEEGDQLTALINSAKECGIIFYYAISPGLDIVYSNAKEVSCLKRKLEQVSQFGCEAFALLFDDIEPEISETDKEIFQSFGHAQVSVTNEVFQSLGHPKFLFCPTEYCASRAVPNVQNSEYLNTIGSKLLPNIDIMWTGNKVISKIITLQSIQELSEVLKRNPVLWDNIHANDYDQKRLFLGPYSDRSTDLNTLLRGVLTNPNCEYEPNFVAIHTLAQWSKCNSDYKCENSSVSADIKLETENDSESLNEKDITTRVNANAYYPRKALRNAIQAWLPEFNASKAAFGKPNNVITTSLATVFPTLTVPPPNLATDVPVTDYDSTLNVESEKYVNGKKRTESLSDSSFKPITKELVNSLVTPPIILNPLEPMDCNASPAFSPKNSSDFQMDEPALKNENSIISESTTFDSLGLVKDNQSIDSTEEMQTESSSESEDESKNNLITYEDAILLVELFYLPFEYGSQGIQFLNEFQWLKTHGHLASQARRRANNESESPEVVEWFERAKNFEKMSQTVDRLLVRLTLCKNRSLLYDLYPYVWDIKTIISLLNSYVKWLTTGKVSSTSPSLVSPSFTWFSKGYKEAFSSGDQEPWIFRGGLIGELQRLLPLESVNDLFIYKPPESPSSQLYSIRPYLATDLGLIYEIYNKSFTHLYNMNDFKSCPDLIADTNIGGYLIISSDYCFVVEDDTAVCGYALAAVDSKKFEEKLKIAWIPELRNKYPLPVDEKISSTQGEVEEESINEAQKLIKSFHNENFEFNKVPESINKTHPSIIAISMLPHITDSSVSKRLLTCILAALKANDSHGVCAKVSSQDKNMIDFYLKLGFQEISISAEPVIETEIFLGRII